MKQTKHKILSVFLSFCMIISCMVGMSATASAAAFSGNCGAEGNNVTWRYDRISGTLTISGTGAMMDFGVEPMPWWDERENITAVSIGNGVTSIGNSAFHMCSNLASVTIPSGVTSIGEGAFYSCKALESVTIPNSVTSIGAYAFQDCTSLTSVTFERPANTGSLSVGENAFVNLDDHYQNVPSTAAIAYSGTGSYALFDGDTEITTTKTAGDLNGLSLTWEASTPAAQQWTNGNVTATLDGTKLTVAQTDGAQNGNMGTGWAAEGSADMWNDIRGTITEVEIKDGVTSIGENAFVNCSALESVTIPGSVTSIGMGAFADCSNLTSVTIPGSVTSIGYVAFYNCTSLRSVTFERPANTGSLYVGDIAFVNDNDNGNNTVPSTAAIAYSGTGTITLFDGTTEITTSNKAGDLSDKDLTWKAPTFTVTFKADGGTPEPEDQTVNSGSTATEPTGVTKTGYTLDGWYKDDTKFDFTTPITADTGLTAKWTVNKYKVTFNSDGGSEVAAQEIEYNKTATKPTDPTKTGYTFKKWQLDGADYDFTAAVTKDIELKAVWEKEATEEPSTDEPSEEESTTVLVFKKVTDESQITDANIAEGTTEAAKAWIISNLDAIKSADNGNGNDFYWKENGNLIRFFMPSDCINESYVSEMNLSLSLSKSGNTLDDIGYFFKYQIVYISGLADSSSTSGESGESGQQWTNGNVTATLVDTKLTVEKTEGKDSGDMGDDGWTAVGNTPAWEDVKEDKITGVEIKDGVTSIGDYAFYGCSALTSITIPSSVTSIGINAFKWCSNLASVTIPSSVTSIGNYAFYGCTALSSVTIPNSVTSIGDSAFSLCKKLSAVTIPGGVTSIGINAFKQCSNLASVTFTPGTADATLDIGSYAFYSTVNGAKVAYGAGDTVLYDDTTKITTDTPLTAIQNKTLTWKIPTAEPSTEPSTEPAEEEPSTDEPAAGSDKTDISKGTVTVSVSDKSVTVTVDGKTVPASEYHIIYFTYQKTEGGESLTRAGTDFPTAADTYIAAVVANTDSESYTGENRSEPFTVAGTAPASAYTLTFVDGDTTVAAYKLGQGTATASYIPAGLTRNGMTFNGWNPGVPPTMPASDLTVYAQWSLNNIPVSIPTSITPTTPATSETAADTAESVTAPADDETTDSSAGTAQSADTDNDDDDTTGETVAETVDTEIDIEDDTAVNEQLDSSVDADKDGSAVGDADLDLSVEVEKTADDGAFENITDEDANLGRAGLRDDADYLENAVLTAEDKAAVAGGETVEVYLEVEEITPPADEQQAIEQEVGQIAETADGDVQVGFYFDASLFKKVGSRRAEQIHETNALVTVSFEIPAAFINSDPNVTRKYSIARLHNSIVTILPCKFSSLLGTVSFMSDEFSTYALIYEDSATVTVDTAETNPHTSAPLVGLAVLAMSASAAAAAFTAKKRKNK